MQKKACFLQRINREKVKFYGDMDNNFYTPVEDGSFYVVPSVGPSVRMSACPSFNFSCPLHTSDTVQDIFMKLSTNINHHQMCTEQEPTLHLHFSRDYGSLKFF